MNMKTVIGIDIAKKSFDVCISDNSDTFHFENSAKGFDELLNLDSVRKQQISLFVIEATGNYHRALVDVLELNGFAVAVVNPRLIKIWELDQKLTFRMPGLFASTACVWSRRSDKSVTVSS